MLSIEETWSNWASTYTKNGVRIYRPQSIEQVSDVVKQALNCRQTVRPFGAKHAFSGVAQPDTIALDLQQLRGLIRVDKQNEQATFWAGTYLHEVGPALEQHGLALQNMGDIDVQSLAGAISTGTHGTGVTLGSISSQVVRWGLIDGEGVYREIFRGDPIAEALHISLGLFGIIVDVTIQAVPVYGLHYESSRMTVSDTLNQFRSIVENNRHAEWYYFPGQSQMQLKVMNPVAYDDIQRRPAKAIDNFLENNVLQAMSTICKMVPRATKWVSKLSADVVPIGEKEDVSYRIFATPRQVRFTECEYAIPLEHFEAFLEEFHHLMTRQLFNVHFPIECRTQKGEGGLLSPTQGRDCAFVAFHMYQGMPYKRYFRFVDELLTKYEGRAHFGKMNRYTRSELDRLYTDINIFLARRVEFDQQGVFMSEYAKNMLEL